LVPPSSRCSIILEFGAPYECNILYKKAFCGFLPFGFPHKFWCTVHVVIDVIFLMDTCHAMLN